MRSRPSLATVLLTLLTSCATIMTGKSDILHVESTPSGAHFTTNTGTSGTTQANIEVPDKVDVEFKFNKEGYQEQTATAQKHISAWVWGNILIGGIIGFIIDVASGGTNTHDGKLSVVLAPSKA